MKTVVVRTHDSAQTTNEIALVTQDGKPNVIKAGENVNYEFFDQSIGRAPNHIITKRVNNDLYVSFEREGKDADLIIQGFYDNDAQALVGIAENGSYYHYIPDTGKVPEYVTQLDNGDIEGQALGGQEMQAPWWVAVAPAAGGFPWWAALGLIPLGIAAAALGGGSDDDGGDNGGSTPAAPKVEPPVVNAGYESVLVTVPKQNADKVVVEYNGGSYTLIKGDDGKWSAKDPDELDINGDGTPDVVVNANTGASSIPTQLLPDNSKVTATTSNTGADGNPADTDTTPKNPDVVIDEKGDNVTINPVDEDTAIKTTIDYKDKNGEPQQIIVNKTDDGWAVDESTPINPDDGIVFDPATGIITIPVVAIKPGSEVSAKNEDDLGQDSPIDAETTNAAPVAKDDGTTAPEDTEVLGNVLDNDDATDGDTLLVVDFTAGTNADGTPKKVKAGETAELTDKDGNPVGDLTINADGGYVFNPAPNFNGDVPTVEYTVTDGKLTDDAALNIEITPVNDAPVADDNTVVVDGGDTIGLGLAAPKDPDNSNDELTIAVTDVPSVGTINKADGTPVSKGDTLTSDELTELTYTAPKDYVDAPVGDFTYSVTDNEGENAGTDDGVVDFTVNTLPQVSITGLTEVNEAVGEVEYTVSLSKPSSKDVTITLDFTNGSATVNEDFTPNSQTITIPAGETQATVTVTIYDDEVYEGAEDYTVSIKEADFANIDESQDQVTSTIFDNGNGTTDGRDPQNPDNVVDPTDPDSPMTDPDEPLPDATDDTPTVVEVSTAEAVEGADLVHTVKLSNASTTDLTYEFAIKGDSATAGQDYQPTPTFSNGVTLNEDGTITVPAGVTEFTVTYPTLDDTYADDGETVDLQINGAIGTGTINDEDGSNPDNPLDAVQISLSDDSTVEEGEVATYTVNLSESTAKDMTVDISYKYISAETGDIVAAITQVTIPKGQDSVDFAVGTIDDNLAEGDEVYSVSIANPTDGGFEAVELGNDTVQTTIRDNDDAPTLTVNDGSVLEASKNTVTNTIVIDNAQSVNSITIGGQEFTLTEGALNIAIPQGENAKGSLKITNYTVTTNNDGTEKGELTYEYTEDGSVYNHKLNPLITESFEVVINDTDPTNEDARENLTITIKDDEPLAVDDTAEVTEDDPRANSVRGSLIYKVATDDVLYNEGNSPDYVGADGLNRELVVVKPDGSTDPIQLPETGSIEIKGKYGSLNINSKGEYDYLLDNSTPELDNLGDGDTATDKFEYVITDGDGDTSTAATLTITINGATDNTGTQTLSVLTNEVADAIDDAVNDDAAAATLSINDIAGGAQSFDLGAIDNSSAVKTVDMTDANAVAQSISLSTKDVLNITDDGNTLFIDGDAADSVAQTGFTQQATSDQAGYTQWVATDNTGATLYIDTDITNII